MYCVLTITRRMGFMSRRAIMIRIGHCEKLLRKQNEYS